MKTCTKCGSTQDSGKFCGKCGAPLSESTVGQENLTEQAQVETSATVDSSDLGKSEEVNPSIEKMKETSKMYWQYFVDYVKRPGKSFSTTEKEFKNGLISIALLGLLLALSQYVFIKNFTWGYGFYSGPSFISIFGSTLILIIALIVITCGVLFLVNRLFGKDRSFKELLTIYSAHLSPVIVVAALAFVLILLKSNTYGSGLIFISIILITLFIPLYLISSLLTRHSKGFDSFYGYLIYFVLTCIVYFILITILADSMMGEIIDSFYTRW